MWTMNIPGRAMRLLRQNAHQPFFHSNAGLNLRLNARSFVQTARPFQRDQAFVPYRGFRKDVSMLLLGGVGLTLIANAHHMKPLQADFDPLQANKNSSSRGYVIGEGDPNESLPFGDDGTDFPKSDVNIYNLGFGSICGICAGVFIKKGLKFVAFLLGGGFILLQYLNSQKIVEVDWNTFSNRYNSVVNRAAGNQDAIQTRKPSSGWSDSTAARIWNRFTHFLTADFPSRGTFLAGLVLGLRLG